jgi:hypothetical protein
MTSIYTKQLRTQGEERGGYQEWVRRGWELGDGRGVGRWKRSWEMEEELGDGRWEIGEYVNEARQCERAV